MTDGTSPGEDPPSLREQVADLARAVQSAGPRLGARLNQLALDYQRSEFSRQLREGVRTLVEEVGPQLADWADRIRAYQDWVTPTNWRRFTIEESIGIANLMRDEGWGLAWVPADRVLRKMLDAPSAEARSAVLAELEGEVLDDLDRALSRVDRPRLADLRWAAREVIEAYRAGYPLAAQALAAATLSTATHDHLGKKFRQARRDFARTGDIDDMGLIEWRVGIVPAALVCALEEYDPMTGEPVRPRFNRHATAHRVERPQYSAENALAAALLVVCLVCELDWIQESIEREEARERAGET